MVEAVSPRARTLVLLLVVSAILYVLISPLPEMSATKSVQPFVLALAFLLVVSITDLMAAFLLNARPSRLEDRCGLQAVLCSRLC
jgi:ABC-type polysaccharide transport system permease subunit